ncbi:MAG TPA: hypothetical protein VME21_17150 [Steroidobacteraceae bacterium]|nr:hypothetical protein [Steroidobacteraceae bacterium]
MCARGFRLLIRAAGIGMALPLPSAWALPPTPLPQIELFIAGSSAQDEALENLMRLGEGIAGAPNICAPATLDIYRGSIHGTANRVFYCRTARAVRGLPAGLRLAVYKSSGGSGDGVTPVSAAKPLRFIDLSRLPGAPGCLVGRPERATSDFVAYRNHSGCDGEGRPAIPRAGLSDVNPELVGGVTAALTVRAQNEIVWGLPVSKNFRNALQTIQGLVPATVPHDDPGRDSEAAMPTLARAQVAAIFAGAIHSWDQFYDPKGTPLTQSSLLGLGPPADPDASGASPGAYRPDRLTGRSIYICRRIESSGTQASYELHYLRARCEPDAPPFVRPDDGSNLLNGGDVNRLVRIPRPAGRVFAGRGTADVRDCLDAHAQFNRWAVGILSTESVGNNGSRKFRFVKVDGAAPTLLNAYLGRWPHVTEQSMQWRRSFDASLDSTNEGRVLRFISTNLGLPRVIAALNSGFVHSWGQGGYLAPARSGFPPPSPPVTADALRTNPVGSLTRSLGRLDNCGEPLTVRPSGF